MDAADEEDMYMYGEVIRVLRTALVPDVAPDVVVPHAVALPVRPVEHAAAVADAEDATLAKPCGSILISSLPSNAEVSIVDTSRCT